MTENEPAARRHEVLTDEQAQALFVALGPDAEGQAKSISQQYNPSQNDAYLGPEVANQLQNNQTVFQRDTAEVRRVIRDDYRTYKACKEKSS